MHDHTVIEKTIEVNPFTLSFVLQDVEGQYLRDVAARRMPVLVFVFCFDVACFLFRMLAKLVASFGPGWATSVLVLYEITPQLTNMAILYTALGFVNRRARKSGGKAARQEELLLATCMALAICNLLAGLGVENRQDYVYVAFFLICTTTFLKIRWWVGTTLLATPTVLLTLWHRGKNLDILPPDAVVHIVVAWAVGGLMAYLNDWYRRQMFANSKLASAAHEKELLEVRARIKAEQELAAAEAQAAQRALIVEREKAAHEAKSEFMSLMCHEVRTPLNGCLASAEMLLETPLEEEQRELAKTIRVSGSILLSTVSNFLDFFKMEAGKQLDIVRTPVDLHELVGDVHCIIEAMIGRQGTVHLKDPDLRGVEQVVCCDPDRVRGILLNLYTNAAKFTRQGHIALTVRQVEKDYVPHPPPGFTTITVAPNYHPGRRKSFTCQVTATQEAAAGNSLKEVKEEVTEEEGEGCGVAAELMPTRDSPLVDGPSPPATHGPSPPATHSSRADAVRHWVGRTKAGVKEWSRWIWGPGKMMEAVRSLMKIVTCTKQVGLRRLASFTSYCAVLNGTQSLPYGCTAAPWQRRQCNASGKGGESDLTSCKTPGPRAAVGDGDTGGVCPKCLDDEPASGLAWGAGDVAPPGTRPSQPPRDLSQKAGHGGEKAGQEQLRVMVEEKDNASARLSGRLSTEGPRHEGEGSCPELAPSRSDSQDAGGSSTPTLVVCQGCPFKDNDRKSPSGRRSVVGGGTSALPLEFQRGPCEGCPWQETSEEIWLLFEVQDTGVGITAEGLRSLFREFVQGTEDEMRKPRSRGGTGLGLSICSKQVGVLGGIVGATSAPEQGSVFWFTIPVLVPVRRQLRSSCAVAAPTDGLVNGKCPTTKASLGATCMGTGGKLANRFDGEISPKTSSLNIHQGHPDSISQGKDNALDKVRIFGTEDRKEDGAVLCEAAGDDSDSGYSEEVSLSHPSISTLMSTQMSSPLTTCSLGTLNDKNMDRQPSDAALTSPVAVTRNRDDWPTEVMRDAKECTPDATLHGSAVAGGCVHCTSCNPSALQKGGEEGCWDASSGFSSGLPPAVRPDCASLNGLQAGMRPAMGPEQVQGHLLMEPIKWPHQCEVDHGSAGTECLYAVSSVGIPNGVFDSGAIDVLAMLREWPMSEGDPRHPGQGEGSAGTGSGEVSASFPCAEGPQTCMSPGPAPAGSTHGEPLLRSQPLLIAPSADIKTGLEAPVSNTGTMTRPPAPAKPPIAGELSGNPACVPRLAPSIPRVPSRCSFDSGPRMKLDPACLKGRRALLAEDNLINQTVARKMLASLGMECVVACNGLEALKKVTSAQDATTGVFDIVLMDMMMPVMGGVESTRAIREQGVNVPIIAMTASASDRDREECIGAGMNGFLSKPVLRDQLAEAIMRVLGLEEVCVLC